MAAAEIKEHFLIKVLTISGNSKHFLCYQQKTLNKTTTDLYGELHPHSKFQKISKSA
jgi:hypothetical protein